MFQLQLDSRISVVELSNSPVVELTSSKELLSMSFSHDYGSLFVISKSEVAPLLVSSKVLHATGDASFQVVKVPTHTCSMLTSCYECVASKDPHCGFCTLERKFVGHHVSPETALTYSYAVCSVRCSIQSDCQQSTDPRRWLQSNSSQCIVISSVNHLLIAPVATPKQVSRIGLTALYSLIACGLFCISDFSASFKCSQHCII